MSYALFFFFFNDTATTEIYPLSLHDALPIYVRRAGVDELPDVREADLARNDEKETAVDRSEEHTYEHQSLAYLVCRLLLEKKKTTQRRRAPGRPCIRRRSRTSPGTARRKAAS